MYLILFFLFSLQRYYWYCLVGISITYFSVVSSNCSKFTKICFFIHTTEISYLSKICMHKHKTSYREATRSSFLISSSSRSKQSLYSKLSFQRNHPTQTQMNSFLYKVIRNDLQSKVNLGHIQGETQKLSYWFTVYCSNVFFIFTFDT